MRWSVAMLSMVIGGACGARSAPAPVGGGEVPVERAHGPRRPITLTYLGVAGWQITDGTSTVLVDPYFSRPVFGEGKPMVIDEAAVAAHAPAKADVIVVGHSHVDHVLDVPAVAKRTGAQVIGTASTARYARLAGVAEDHIIPVQGGEDYAFGAFSVRVLPGLHSALDEKHTHGGQTEIAADATLPMTFDQFAEGGTLSYLVRMAGHEILILSSANYIEREVAGLRPDIAIVATGLREEIHDYSCRLMRLTGAPARVLTNHFDAWREPLVPTPPIDAETQADLDAFAGEIRTCAPQTRVDVPVRFQPITID